MSAEKSKWQSGGSTEECAGEIHPYGFMWIMALLVSFRASMEPRREIEKNLVPL